MLTLTLSQLELVGLKEQAAPLLRSLGLHEWGSACLARLVAYKGRLKFEDRAQMVLNWTEQAFPRHSAGPTVLEAAKQNWQPQPKQSAAACSRW